MNRPILFLTDFGLNDHYVGAIKSVILGINPNAVMHDLTHEIRPQNVREGAFVLKAIYPLLPKQCIVVAVVDPGVGSEREALCIKTGNNYLIGPDNGLLSMALQNERFEARRMTNHKFFRKPVSATFHGRDIFSPCAAWLSMGNIFKSLGPKTRVIKKLQIAAIRRTGKKITGEIIYIDRFGNAMTNIAKTELKAHPRKVMIKRNEASMKSYFGAGKANELIALWNSSDALELAVHNESAEKLFGFKIGDQVEIIEN